MATKILRPSAAGYTDTWTLGAGASEVAAVDTGDPVSHDDDTTYIVNNETNQAQYFTLTGIPAGIGRVNSVSLGSRARVTAVVAGNSMDDGVYLGGSTTTVNSYALAGTTYVTMGPTAAARPGGGSYTAADITSLQMGIRSSAGAVTTFRCTSLWISLDYTLAGSAVVQFFGYLLPLIGPCLQFSQMRAVAEEIRRREGTLLAPSEYREAWDAWRAYRHPRYAF